MDSSPDDVELALRWRLLLGRHADRALSLDTLAQRAPTGEGDVGATARDARELDRVLSFLYDREFARRGHQRAGAGQGSGLVVPEWLRGVRVLFPQEAVEVVERDALARYGLTELVTDPEVLRSLEPTEDLVKAILQFKHLMSPEVLTQARILVRQVVEQLAEKLKREVQPALTGPVDPERARPARTFRNADWHRTIRRNLKNWDPQTERLVADRIEFRNRQRGRAAWRIVVAVDQSGSMLDNLIHAAILASILASLPAITVHLVLWDHRVLDVTPHVHDPLEVLMGAQLGGGTRLLPALRHCASLITEPERTVLAVVSDWYVYDEAPACLALAHELVGAGVKGLGLCALNADGHAEYDRRFASALAGAGWWVAAVTPRHLAEHVARVIS